MEITSYTDLLDAAHAQPEPQRLLFVFAEAELPEDATAEQQKEYGARRGGALTPVMTVDKLPTEVTSFAGLVEESRETGKHWDIVFVASLSGRDGAVPGSNEADQPLRVMIASIKSGNIRNYITFNRSGEMVRLS